MKTNNFLNYLLVLLLIAPFSAIYSNKDKNRNGLDHNGKTNDSLPCLEIKGKFSKTAYKTKNTYTVELIRNNSVEKTVNVTDGNTFKFYLKHNDWYAIKILEKDCVPKLISVSTKLPKGVDDDILYGLSFVIEELISDIESRELDTEALDFPVAIFSFDPKLKMFNINEEYTRNIRKEMCRPLINFTSAAKIDRE